MFFKTKIKENTKEHHSINLDSYMELLLKKSEASKNELKNLKTKFAAKESLRKDINIDFDKFFYN